MSHLRPELLDQSSKMSLKFIYKGIREIRTEERPRSRQILVNTAIHREHSPNPSNLPLGQLIPATVKAKIHASGQQFCSEITLGGRLYDVLVVNRIETRLRRA